MSTPITFLPSSLMTHDYSISAYRLFELMDRWVRAVESLKALESTCAAEGKDNVALMTRGSIVATEECVLQVKELLAVSIPWDEMPRN